MLDSAKTRSLVTIAEQWYVISPKSVLFSAKMFYAQYGVWQDKTTFDLEQWSATGSPQAKTGPPAIISGLGPQPDYFDSGVFWNRSVITVQFTHNQSMWVERCDFEWNEEWIFLKVRAA